MLDPAERRRFNGIVTHLGHQDPRFVRRIRRVPHAERRNRTLWAVLLWGVPPLLIIVGGRIGLVVAASVCAAGAYLLLWRRGGGSGRLARRHGVP